jgi:DNA-binding LytR/AlgR family response regulator
MTSIKIVIVEDEIIIAKTIVLALHKLGYDCIGIAGQYNEAIAMIDEKTPDLVLIDINLGTKKDGIDLALEIKEQFNTPVIFLTANSDPATISRAKAIRPLAFLVKPFSQHDLFSAIEIGWNNFITPVKSDLNPSEQHIVLKIGSNFEKVQLNDIVYLEKDHHYFDIHLISSKKIVVRYTTNEMTALLLTKQFVKVNKSFIVNVRHILKIESKFVYLADRKLLIAKGKQKELLLLI